jgi:hypothetical protein
MLAITTRIDADDLAARVNASIRRLGGDEPAP